jgi:AcrR family transcriptional regulator
MAEVNDTRDKLLESAERLYADNGIAGTSLRKIVADANANIAAVHYHFGSKAELTRAVFSRRIQAVNKERLELLASLHSKHPDRPIPIRELLYAFLSPAVLMGQDRDHGGTTFFRLAARAHAETDENVQAVLLEELQEIVQIFLKELLRSTPHLKAPEAALRLCFAAGGMMQAVLVPENKAMVDLFFGGKPDPHAVLNSLVEFVAAGFQAPVKNGGKQ